LLSNDYAEFLDRAARLWGIDPEYWDIWGRKHFTSTETQQAILRAMGVDTSSAEALANATAERERTERTRLVPPCLVISECAWPRVAPLHAPDSAGRAVHVRIQREDGAEQSYEAPAGDTLPLPLDLPLGYHDVEVALGERRASMRLMRPRDAPPAWRWRSTDCDRGATGVAATSGIWRT
jgi:4-alpha-glucanotransferase